MERDGRTIRARERAFLAVVAGVAAWGCVSLTGCARSRIANSLARPVAPGDMQTELAFWDAASGRAMISNDEGLHGLLLFAQGDDACKTYDERLARAREAGWVAESWHEDGDLAMQRGTLARAVAVHCKITGGVMMRVLGPVPRYALRELQYLGMMGTGSEQQAVSGREFMGVLSKAQDYLLLEQAVARADAEAAMEKVEAAAPAPPPPAPPPAPPAATGPAPVYRPKVVPIY